MKQKFVVVWECKRHLLPTQACVVEVEKDARPFSGTTWERILASAAADLVLKMPPDGCKETIIPLTER